MRRLLKGKSTKAERIFYEILKELDVPFKHRWIVEGREIDFIINDTIAVEIDGHKQDPDKNNQLVQLGYSPIHLENVELLEDKEKVKKELTWLIQHLEGQSTFKNQTVHS